MAFDFTSIDFETANHHRASPCAVGLARVRNGVVVDAASWLMRPPRQHAAFHPYNVGIHGISSAAVAGAPTFRDSLPRVLDFIGSDLVCAHNARFDGAVLHAAAQAEGLPAPHLRYLCTLQAARRHLALPSYRLPFVADALGVALPAHHDPASDALATAMIVPALARHAEVADIEALLLATQTPPARPPLPSVDAPNAQADRDHPLWGRVVVFTGTLSTMTRSIAHEECIRVGAMPEKVVTRRTNVLVVGELDPARLVPGDATSQKAQKAFALRASGQDIEVMTEHDLLRHL